MRFRGLSQVQNFYDFKFASKQGSASIIAELPIAIQIELIKQKYGALIAKVCTLCSLLRSA